MPPKFSIILPTFNRAHMLPGALETVRRQTFEDYEVLIVDDGSVDETPRTIQSWLKDPRLKYRRLEKNIGNMYCRNLALGMATGEWITNIDSDDFWMPDRLERFVEFFKAHPKAGFVFSNGFLFRYGRIIGRAFDLDRPIREGKVPGYYAVGEEFLPYLTTNLAIPRALYEKYGHYRKDMVILDNELYARMLEDGVEVGVIRKPLAIRRIHEGQVTHKWIEEYPEAVEALKAGGTPPDVLEIEKRKLALEVSNYLWRALQPAKSREFLLRELGQGARRHALYWKTWIPSPALARAKRAREAYLRARYWPGFAPADFRQAQEFIRPMLEAERAAAPR